MRVHLVLIALIGLLMLAGAGTAALIPDQNSTISSSAANGWIVVWQQSTFTVYAYNTTAHYAISGATVIWALNTTTLGTLSSTNTTTDVFGQTNTTFTAGSKSGSVIMTATISYNGTSVQKTCTLNIDHDIPYYAVFNYQSLVTVATITPFNVTFTDKWGNPIDNRNPYNPQYVNLLMGASPTDTAAFSVNSTFPKFLTLQPDQNGNISVNVLTDTTGGENIIELYFVNSPPDEINRAGLSGTYEDYEEITGITNGVPYSITQSVTPDNPPSLKADGASDQVFTFIYSLKDQFNNNAENQSVLIQTNFGDPNQILTSDSQGDISFNYGPHTTAGNVTVTATALSNTSVNCSFTIQYYSAAPVNMAFSVNPGTMPSIDADSTSTAQLSAKIMDVMGNPVAGQTVSFSIGPVSSDTPYVSSAPYIGTPYLVNATAISDSNGYATVTFIPGGFNTTNNKWGLFSATATASTQATATWSGQSQIVQLTWKNYPYLKITTSVSPQVVPVNGTINVTISLLGDGWKLQGQPADVVVVTDLAGGILGTTLLGYTQSADNAFVLAANNTTSIGLVSFGAAPDVASNDAINLYAKQSTQHDYSLFQAYGTAPGDFCLRNPSLWDTPASPTTIIDGPPLGSGDYTGGSNYNYINGFSDATIDSTSFVDHQAELNGGKPLETAIANYKTRFLYTGTVPPECGEPGCGGTDYAAGINAALQFFAENPDPLSTHSIVIMGDGITMMAPLAPNSTESYWPSDWYPRSYFGYLDESDTSINAAIAASQLARAEGINIYAAGYELNGYVDNSTLESLVSPPYTSNYHYMADSSDLESTMLAIQGQIQQNAGVNTSLDLNYNNVSVGYGTQTVGVNYTYNPPYSTSITWQNNTVTTTDQSSQWAANHQLNWPVGNITLDQTWQTTFQLQATQQGILDVCGNSSQAIFNNGADYENISGCTVTVVSNETNVGASQLQINITNFQVTQPPPYTTSIPLQWNITYPGNSTAQEILWYSTDNSHWTAGPTWSITKGNWTESQTLDVSNFPSGTYYLMLQASAPDASCNSALCPADLSTGMYVGTAGQKAYIKLQ
jgi:hypothetical protein